MIVLAVGLYITAAANRAQQDANRAQQLLAERGQVTDRFTKANEQLGQEDEKGMSRLSIRLGAIHALARLMRDSPPDEPAIIELLSAFVRTHAAHPKGRSGAVVRQEPGLGPRSPADVRAAVVALAERPGRHRIVDLEGAYLSMFDAPLDGVRLLRTDLHDANLRDAKLRNTNLSEANLADANLRDADLSAANLHEVDLSRASLRDANLSGTDLTEAVFAGTDLRGADLSGASGLGGESVRCARVDAATDLPPGVPRPATNAPDTPRCRVDAPPAAVVP